MLALLGFLLAPQPAEAANSACKGLSSSACGSKSACTWVDGYTTKKGTKVSAYCRAKGSKGTGKAKGLTSESKKSTDKKTKKVKKSKAEKSDKKDNKKKKKAATDDKKKKKKKKTEKK
ncbi:exported protein of unknown function [Magnetospira sp. QH-2]|nr:exported protein of unknown function [Magnetospira sp. QH-2]